MQPTTYHRVFVKTYMARVVVDISLSREKLLLIYQGVAKRALIYSRDGRSISLPVKHLLPHITHSGVYGTFVLEFDEQGSLLALKRLSQ